MKKLLLIIMALISLMGGLNAQSSEEITIDYDGYSLKFEKNTNGLSVSCATKPTSPTVITVPDSVTMPDGLKYQVEVVYSFEDCSYMTGIELPNTIRLISGSFENCTSLTSIEIPRSVQYFNGPVFKGSGIESIYIPNNVLDIGFWTFRDCANLRSITFEEGSQIQIIDSYVFENCSSLERIEIPETVTEIEDYAFYGCSSLSRVIFGENSQLTTIGQSAFYVCEKLNSINFPKGVTSIGKSAFYGTKIESVYIPNTVTEIGKSAFSNNYAITSVTFEENSQLAIIDDNTFYACTQLTSIEIPNTVTEIRGSAFNSCSNMTTVTFEENSQLTAIGQYAFKSCSSLERIEIPETVTEIGDYAFYICSSLSHVIFGENSQLTAIGQSAFRGCSSLESIEIPETVTVIGASAFRNCSSLSHVIFGENSQLTAIGEYAFSYCLNLESVYIPNTVTEIGEYAFEHCKSLTTVNIPDSIAYISKGLFNTCLSLESVEIPETVTEIGEAAFYGCSSLSNVEIPDAVTYIGDEAFVGTGLTSINIPSSVEIVGQYAFSYCPKLESITVEEGNQYYDSRNNCNAIIEIYDDLLLLVAACKNTIIPENIYGIYAGAFAGVDMESIVLPASVQGIGAGYDYYYGTFMESTIKTIELPSSLLYLDEAAFYGCSNLNTIRCRAESVPELSSIIGSSGEYLFYDCPSDMTIQVPASSLEDYQNTYPWNEYNLVAGFYYNINAKVDSTEYGRVEGAGEYDEGTTATLTAIPNADYIFLNWTENGKVVSTDAEYSFEVETDRNLTANFIYALHVPTNLVATAESHTAISLSWNVVENALSYNIYQDGELIGQQSPSTGSGTVQSESRSESESSVSYLVENLEYDTEYCFTVTAVRNETETEKSEAACATTFDLPITTPTNLVATAESHTAISLSWNVVENALSYNIYKGEELVGQQSTVNGQQSSVSYLVENLEYNTEYCFTVTAVRNETETEKSEAACATTFDLPITTPTNLVATAESHTAISLSWDIVENALSYNIYQDGELIGQQSPSTGSDIVESESVVSYLVENLDYDTEYCFTVTAVRNETETEKSEAACATTLGDGLEELTSSFEIYPNPVLDKLHIDADTDADIEIYNIKGQQVYKSTRLQACEQQSIDVSDLDSGVYLVRIRTAKGDIMKRIIKK